MGLIALCLMAATVTPAQPEPASEFAPTLRYEVSAVDLTERQYGNRGGTIILDCRLINDGDEALLVYWGDTAFGDQYLFQIQGPDGREPYRKRERLMPPSAAALNAKSFERLEPGGVLTYKIYLGDTAGRNTQVHRLREVGEYIVAASLHTYVVPADFEDDLELDFAHVARNAVITDGLNAAPISVTVTAPELGYEPGDITIEVTALDHRNRPVSGAVVRVVQYMPRDHFGDYPYFGSTDQKYPGIPADLDQDLTDDRGRIFFRNLPNNAPFFEIIGVAPGFMEAKSKVDIEPATRGYDVRLVLERDTTPVFTVSGWVVDNFGEPIPGVRILRYGHGTFYTDDEGWFSIDGVGLNDEGKVRADFWRRDYLSKDEYVSPAVAQSGDWTVRLHARAGTKISGQALFGDATFAANMQLNFKSDGERPRVYLSSVTTDDRGFFTTEPNSPNTFTGSVELEESVEEHYLPHHRWRAHIADVEPGTQNLRIVFENRATIVANIEPAAPMPPSRQFVAKLEIANLDGVGRSLIGHETVDGAGGSKTFSLLSPGEYTLTVIIENAPSREWKREIVISENTPAERISETFEIPKLEFGSLQGHVFDGAGMPMENARVLVTGPIELRLDSVE